MNRKDIIEKVDIEERVSATKSTKRALVEDLGRVRGFVTVIKNKGRVDEQILSLNKENLLTEDGRDYIHEGIYTVTTGTARAFNFMALSSSTDTPATNHTAIDAEIATGGLTRVQATVLSHSDDTNVSTVEQTFTASATFSQVQLSGIFNAVSGVTLGHENTFTPADLEINDTLTVTWTITAG